MSSIIGQTFIAKYQFICTITYFFSWLFMAHDYMAGINGLKIENITTTHLYNNANV